MRRRAFIWITGAAVFACAVLLLAVQSGTAGGNKKVQPTMDKMADLFRQGKTKEAVELAKQVAKKIEYLEDVMHAFSLRKPDGKGGVGIGKPGEIRPDGIEIQLGLMGRDAPSKRILTKHKDDLLKAAWLSRAIAEVTIYAVPSDLSKAEKKMWSAFTKQMQSASEGFAKSLQTVSPADVQKAARTLKNSCDACHAEFR